ncbi:chitin synthase-domain-containing protein [Halteromyces radiatus]|uniref:chitin synthase-domain-containing protein n=1 Tax=Halteromyces radiatus TaxID=101107 RepID=UPI00221EB2ED|nr:chitin synthase-domain-containing protein [Halteromyces radiatus]KAI8088683.1 chitin synthase-domain-containing protein [Halteromyces radiatus]
MLAAPLEEKQRLALSGDGSNMMYLAHTSTLRAASIDDTQLYQNAQQAFKILGFSRPMIVQIFQILAAILHLGNLIFCQDPVNAQDAAVVKNMDTLTIIADLLGVDSKSLLNTLTYKSKLIKRDITTLFLDPIMASKQRDDLAQSLYVVVFSWMVEHINTKLSKQQKTAHSWIALLDGWGPNIRLSQSATLDDLTVNFVNEALHQSMLVNIFERDMKDYQDQGLTLPASHQMEKSTNNNAVMDAFHHPSKGIFSILNTQAGRVQQRSKDDVVMDHFISANKSNDTGVQFKKANHANSFTIQHYWGPVNYDPSGFTERNEDYLCSDFVTLFRGNAYNTPTTNGLLATVFSESSIGDDATNNNRVHITQRGVLPQHRTPIMTGGPPTLSSPSSPTWDHVPTMGDQLLLGVQQLQQVLQSTVPWFVLCMRPNDMMLAYSCDARKLTSQTIAFKLSALAQRLQVYYNTVFSLQDFWDRYCVSLPITTGAPIDNTLALRDRCISIFQSLQWNESKVGVGREKIYLSNQAFCILEYDLRGLEKAESKKNKSSPTGLSPMLRRDNYDGYSFNEDQYSSAVSEDAYDMDDNSSPQNYVSDIHSTPMMMMMMDEKQQRQQHQQQHKSPNGGLADIIPEDEDVHRMTSARRKWLILVWLLTWWVPSPFLNWCGGMKRKDIRLAWREKVTLCILIFLMSASMVVFIIFFGPLICPHQDVFSSNELQGKSDKDSAYVAIRGEVFDLTKFAPHHWASEVIPEDAIFDYAGKDATNLFPLQVSALCDGTDGHVSEEVVLDFQVNLTDKNAAYHDFRYFTNDYRPDWYFEQLVYMRKNYRLGFMGYEPRDILRQATNVVNVGDISTHRQWAILHGDVYDLTYYLMGGRVPRAPKGQPLSGNINLNFMDNGIVELFRQLAGTDISKHFDALPIDEALRSRQLVCLRNLFFVGKVDTRRSFQCQFSEYFLLIVTGFLCAVILFKFLAALQLGTQREPEEYDKFIVCQVPCYTESEESLRKTIDSIAVLRYDDKRKLILLVCDGMLIGSGNDRPTPRIVLDILGVDPNVDPEPLSFFSLGEGAKQHNMGKIYSGLYECAGHVVPYLVVVKVGGPGERQKPGNRGKRDSQMVLLRFLNKVHFESAMAPMELEMYHQIKNVIGVNPSFYEFVLMVDADTEVLPDSLNRMVSCFVHDSKIVGLCGETKLANEKDSWVTMIQVYEYYISHFLAKAFESLFGSVTCLPGCFCMYRVRSPAKQQPLLISNQVIQDYSENRVNTLHQKNLLHLGEDRYLTTLILKHFPTYKTKFTADAGCLTNAPDRWSILLSQRRRWINSTIHNLGELMFLPQLCGFCCFSMRFVVILDLLSTLTMPAIVCYLIYLIYRLVTDANQVPMISIITLGGVYGLQAIIFILRRKWEHIGWMIVYILAIPLFSFFMPIYSFWHFDDFSWGNTRVVVGEGGQKKAMPADEGRFDPRSIPLKKWKDHENEIWETNSVETKITDITATSRRSQQLQQQQQQQMMAAMSSGIASGIYSMAPPPSHQLQSDTNSMLRYSQSQQFFRPSSILPGNVSVYSEPHQSMMMYPTTTAPLVAHNTAFYPSSPMMNNPSQFSYQQQPPYPHQQHQPLTAMDIPDEDIQREVQRITTTADLTTMTKKQVREELGRHFGMDMTPRKDFINHCIEEALRCV